MLVEGVRSSRLWSTSQLLRPYGQEFSVTLVGSAHKSRGDNVVRMAVSTVEEMIRVGCVGVTEVA